MSERIATNVRTLRARAGLTQEALANRAKLSSRTISRVEEARAPSLDTLQCIADALSVTVDEVLFGLSADQIDELRALALCPHCDAPLAVKHSVDYYDVDVDVEVFECGYSRGFQSRPCPHSPEFPKLGDFEITFQLTDHGEWFYDARPLTDGGRNVDLGSGVFLTREAAEAHVKETYAALTKDS